MKKQKKLKGAISKKGYMEGSPDQFNDFNLIPSNQITMKNVNQNLKLIPMQFPQGTMGQSVVAKPGREYNFPGYNAVLEIPQRQMGGSMYPFMMATPQFYGGDEQANNFSQQQDCPFCDQMMQAGGTPTYEDSMNLYNTSQARYEQLKKLYGSDWAILNEMDLPPVKVPGAIQPTGRKKMAQIDRHLGAVTYDINGKKVDVPEKYAYKPQAGVVDDFFDDGNWDESVFPLDYLVANGVDPRDPKSLYVDMYKKPVNKPKSATSTVKKTTPTTTTTTPAPTPTSYYGIDIVNGMPQPIVSTLEKVPVFDPGLAGLPQPTPPPRFTPPQYQASQAGMPLFENNGRPIMRTGRPPLPGYLQGPGTTLEQKQAYWNTHDAAGNPISTPTTPTFQMGGSAQYSFDQYYKDLNSWQNPSAQSVPKNIANYESTWIVPTIKTYQQTLNSALATKYNLAQGTSPAQDQFLTALEAQEALGGSQQYGDYLNYIQGYQAYRGKTSGTYQAPSQTSGTMDPNGEAYGYRHFGLFNLTPQQAQANQANTNPALLAQSQESLPAQKEGGNWLGKASDKMKKKGTEGAFTEYCGGKVTSDCIERGLKSKDPKTRKRAAFAKAMHSIAKKELGGDVPEQYEGLGYLEKKNAMFFNTLAKNNLEHIASQEYEDMYSLHQQMLKTPKAQMGMQVGPEVQLPQNDAWQWGMNPTQIENPYPNQNVIMDSNQTAGAPVTSDVYNQPDPQQKLRFGFASPESKANAILSGTSWLANMLENTQKNNTSRDLRMNTSSDSLFLPVTGSRGDYEMNSGAFRPDQMVPVQFGGYQNMGYGRQSYQEGGEYSLDDDEIQAILAAGGEIEYVD